MKLFLKISAVILLLGYLIASFVLFSEDDRRVRCQNLYITVIDSTECDLIKADDIYDYIERLGLSPVGKSCRLVNTEAIEQSVRQIDILRDVQCYHKRNGDIYLTVEQRHPVMRVVTDENESYYLDENGATIAVNNMYLDYLPLVLGCIDDTLPAVDLLPMVRYISADSFWNAQTEHIYVSPQHEVSLMPRVGGHVILLGTPDEYEDKLARVLAMYKQVMPRIGWTVYDTISVKYSGQVLCTRIDKNYKHKTWTKN